MRSVADINFMVATCLIILCQLEQLEHRYVLLLNSENSQTNIEIRNQLFIINMEMKIYIYSLCKTDFLRTVINESNIPSYL